jgi:small subunit ribosomal protein S1
MSEDKESADKMVSSKEFTQNQLEEQYIKSFQSIEEGQLLNGKVVQISPEHVFVDVGYKSEGKIEISEFSTPPAVGDQVDVVLVAKEGREGSIVVSKNKADEKIFWRDLRKAYSNREPFEGKISKYIKGGCEVDLGFDVRAFLPLSKIDIYRVDEETINEYIGKKYNFMVERLYSNGKVNIILSRRAWLEKESERNRTKFFEDVRIGDEVEGFVKSFTSFGAFIDLGNFDGLLHINDMSWGHVTSPKEVLKVGEKLNLKVIRLDKKDSRINLSLKHFTEDPWTTFEERYHLDDVVKGKVTKLTNFGVFIELEEGIEGLTHISELSWVKRIRHPKEILKIGDEVDVKILNYDITQGKVSLGFKQVLPNPWDDIESRFPVGMRIKRKVKNLSNFGAFFELEEGIDGLLHLDDFSWTNKYKHPSELLKEGEEIEITIIDIDKENNRIKLGFKQLSEDPWKSLQKAYKKGSSIEGTITGITDFGLFMKVQGDIEGLISNSNLYDSYTETLEDIKAACKVGDSIKAVVLEINSNRQRLSLSRKDYFKQLHKEELSRYIHDESVEEKATLGDIIKEKTSE